MKLNILGTKYTVTTKKYDEDDAFKKRSICGYCDDLLKCIVICDVSTCEGWENESQEAVAAQMRETTRHEIVHAFLSESGLIDSSSDVDGPWAKNEEMIDWFAIQGPKIYAAWKKAGVVE